VAARLVQRVESTELRYASPAAARDEATDFFADQVGDGVDSFGLGARFDDPDGLRVPGLGVDADSSRPTSDP
jgi:hypothetical protein